MAFAWNWSRKVIGRTHPQGGGGDCPPSLHMPIQGQLVMPSAVLAFPGRALEMLERQSCVSYALQSVTHIAELMRSSSCSHPSVQRKHLVASNSSASFKSPWCTQLFMSRFEMRSSRLSFGAGCGRRLPDVFKLLRLSYCSNAN